ncbi:hypothetical protein VTN31DRAFT_1659 [Thermomyces dupontii]|uniref:uncharacterized protein n=1 Tax=Talaromyces thermophilus TaxID=28565 RepID=UPI003743A68B
MASCYDTRPAHDILYYTTTYGVLHHSFGPLAPQYAAGYGKQDVAGIQGADIRSALGTTSPMYQPPFVHDPFRYQRSEIESQESYNEDTALSEPISPPLEGFPNVHDFDLLIKSYVNDLSSKKQDKALISAKRARNIRTVLLDPKGTAVESAQFRFWVKKMFKLEPEDSRAPDGRKLICHEGKPVAVREKLFKILTKAHQQCNHGGRDKTSAQVRQTYSWVPKELISRFVKICPTCQVRRGSSPSNSQKSAPYLDNKPFSPSYEVNYGRSSMQSERPHHQQDLPGVTWSDASHSAPQLQGASYHHATATSSRGYDSASVRALSSGPSVPPSPMMDTTLRPMTAQSHYSYISATPTSQRYNGYTN